MLLSRPLYKMGRLFILTNCEHEAATSCGGVFDGFSWIILVGEQIAYDTLESLLQGSDTMIFLYRLSIIQNMVMVMRIC